MCGVLRAPTRMKGPERSKTLHELFTCILHADGSLRTAAPLPCTLVVLWERFRVQ